MLNIFSIIDYLSILNIIHLFMQYIYLIQKDCHMLVNMFIQYDGYTYSLDKCFKYIVKNVNDDSHNKVMTLSFDEYISNDNLCYVDYNFMAINNKSYICCILFVMKEKDTHIAIIYDVYNVRIIYYRSDVKLIKCNSYNGHIVKYNDYIIYQMHIYTYIISKVMNDIYNLQFLYSTSEYIPISKQYEYIMNIMRKNIKFL